MNLRLQAFGVIVALLLTVAFILDPGNPFHYLEGAGRLVEEIPDPEGAFYVRLQNRYGNPSSTPPRDKADLIAHALATEGLAAADTWMIGDRLHDVRAARRNGLTAVGVLWGYGNEDELREAGPAHVVRTLDELRAWIAAVSG